MKRRLCILTALLVLAVLTACSTDTYTQQSTLPDFKLKNVSEVTLYGPDSNGSEGIEIALSNTGGADYTRLVQLVQGRKQETCETADFGLCYIAYSFTTGETVKVYPANDGSPYVCLFSLNDRVARYLTLPEADMAELTAIMEKYGIQVIYK